jgi:hypothetical protein
MAWKNALDNTHSFGDRPYGSYWEEVPSEDVPFPTVPQQVTVQEQLTALRKAVLTNDKADLITIDAATATVEEVK